MNGQILIVALTLMMEAGGEPYAGKIMVGEVIVNRAIHSGKPLDAVCLKPKAFSCWNKTARQRAKRLIGTLAWKDCVEIATAISQPGYVPVSPATHYFNPSKASPSWAKKMELVAVVGHHQFYVEKGTP